MINCTISRRLSNLISHFSRVLSKRLADASFYPFRAITKFTGNVGNRTVASLAAAMRAAGFKTTETTIADAIACGRYPFGVCLSKGATGRRRFEIFRVDFEQWLATRIA